MTLQSSGTMTGADIRNELRQSGGNLVFPSATTRWLCDKAAGAISIPDDYYSKIAVKRTHTEATPVGNNSVSLTAQLGIDFPNRRFITCVCASATTPGSALNFSGATLDGVSLTAGPGGFWFNPSNSIAMGIYISPVGITGTAKIFSASFNQSISAFGIVVYSGSNWNNTFHTNANGGQPQNTAGTTINVDTNGVVLVHAIKVNCTDLSVSGVNQDTTFDCGPIRVRTGFQNRLGAQSGRSFGMAGNGAADICEVVAVSFGS